MDLKKPDETVINIGSGEETTINRVCELAQKITGQLPEIVYNPKRVGGLDRMRADLTLAREMMSVIHLSKLFERNMRVLHRRRKTVVP